MKKIIFTAFILILFPNFVSAKCICTCFNGKNQPLCESSIDLPPICSPKICPIMPPSIKPLTPLTLPPIGTKKCRMKQVLNPFTNKYEWKSVCR